MKHLDLSTLAIVTPVSVYEVFMTTTFIYFVCWAVFLFINGRR